VKVDPSPPRQIREGGWPRAGGGARGREHCRNACTAATRLATPMLHVAGPGEGRGAVSHRVGEGKGGAEIWPLCAPTSSRKRGCATVAGSATPRPDLASPCAKCRRGPPPLCCMAAHRATATGER